MVQTTYHMVARAKVNLALHVIGKRPDGYHTLESLVAFANFGDYVSITSAKENSFEIKGEFATKITSNNIIEKAKNSLIQIAKERNIVPFPVKISLTKNIPVAAGLGGGSADAAAVLKLLNLLWQINLDSNELNEIATKLGADVPMCLYGKTCVVKGIGDIILPSELPKPLYILLVNPRLSVATEDVFNALQTRNNARLTHLPMNAGYLDLQAWFINSRNDLVHTAARLEPIIDYVLRSLKACAVNYMPRMSGSGATCFTLFENEEDAKKALIYARKTFPSYWVQLSTLL